jgi:hypothetical protein
MASAIYGKTARVITAAGLRDFATYNNYITPTDICYALNYDTALKMSHSPARLRPLPVTSIKITTKAATFELGGCGVV